ncbi:hypothetical protein ACHQM5_029971 [Ranunculus cassubicifolius]
MAPGIRASRRVQPDSATLSDGIEGATVIRRRGVAANNAVDKYKKQTGQRPKVVFNAGLARPVGMWAKEFTTEVGIACRMFAPLTCKNWKEVNDKAREKFHERILENFDVDLHNPHVMKVVNKFLAQRLREHRCRLHRYYKNLGDSIDKRQRPPKNLSQENWNALCSTFETEEFKVKVDSLSTMV